MPIITNQNSDPWIEKVDQEKKLKDEIREEVISEIKEKKRKKLFTCCLLELLFVILVLGGIVTAIAKTGLIDIPVFSKLFYEAPTPDREVSTTPGEEKKFEDILAEKIKQQIKVGEKSDTGQLNIALNFTEEELTGFLKAAEINEDYPFSNSQISISSDGVEIFGQLKEFNQTFLTATLKPEVVGEELKISFTKISIGNLSLPPAIGNFFINKFLKDQLDSIKELISKNGKLENIELSPGKLIFYGTLSAATLTK
ncbi:hypothetical protein KKD80_03575 [Patescibacteria group bacterium]|nr:hypothetical protein [Patescibacteria group bacterium]